MATFDDHANFAASTVNTAPTPPTSGTSLTVAAGQGTRFPTPPFNATVWPAGATPTPSNAEIVRVTARATDTLTISRLQESTTARAIGSGDAIAATITDKTLTDIETQLNLALANPLTMTGDMIFSSSGSTPARLAAVATGAVLASAGVNTAPAWNGAPTLGGLTLFASGDVALTLDATSGSGHSYIVDATGSGSGFGAGHIGIWDATASFRSLISFNSAASDLNLYISNVAATRAVSAGPTDSAGSGYRYLRVPN